MSDSRFRDYDPFYARVPDIFGAGPDDILPQHAGLLPAGASVLDIGAGQGRHALFGAERGWMVHALEPSRVGREAITEAAAASGLEVAVFAGGFADFRPPVAAYDGILVFGLIPDLDRPGITALVGRIAAWSRPGTLLWITGFTTEDPAFPKWRSEAREIDPNSFVNADGRVRTFLAPGEILEMIPGWEAVHHWEGLGPEHRHGDGPPERHGRFESLLKRG